MELEAFGRQKKGVICVESGGPEPGVGCAGRGIISLSTCSNSWAITPRNLTTPSTMFWATLSAGGFRYATFEGRRPRKMYIIISGEMMAMYAANNILTNGIGKRFRKPVVFTWEASICKTPKSRPLNWK